MAKFNFYNPNNPCPGMFPFPIEKTTTPFAEGSLILTLEEMMYWYYKVRAIKITGNWTRDDLPIYMSDSSCNATVPVAREGNFGTTTSPDDTFRSAGSPANANGLMFYVVSNSDKKTTAYLSGPEPPSGGWDELAFLNTKPKIYGSGCQGPMFVGLSARSIVYQYELDGGCLFYSWTPPYPDIPEVPDYVESETDPEWYWPSFLGAGADLRVDVEVSMFYKFSEYLNRTPYILQYTDPLTEETTYQPQINVSSSTTKDITLTFKDPFGDKEMIWENPNTSTVGSAEIEITPTEFWTFD